jgi:hypothetical protein
MKRMKKIEPLPTDHIPNVEETIIPKEFLDSKASNPNYELHHLKLPFRAICVAPSGCGKSNFITYMITQFSVLEGTFADITIVCQDKDEAKYRFLESKGVKIVEGIHNVPHLKDFDKDENHLLVLDDLQNESHQQRISDIYCRGRKKNLSVVYIAQQYFEVPTVVRRNTNYVFILAIGSEKELPTLLKDCGASEVDKDTLRKMYDYATEDKGQVLTIEQGSVPIDRKYRKNLKEYLDISKFK